MRNDSTNRWLAKLLTLALLAGCQQQMAQQPSYKPLDPSDFFDDGLSARPLVPGTVARGHLRSDTAMYQGRRVDAATVEFAPVTQPASTETASEITKAAEAAREANFVDAFPFPITEQILQHGFERYMIYCVVCHDALGTGRGKIVERGYTQPPSYHIERLRNAPVGRLFAVISEGYGSMPSYSGQISPRDRWAIAAYVRVLQQSQHFPEADLTAQMRAQMNEAPASSAEQRITP